MNIQFSQKAKNIIASFALIGTLSTSVTPLAYGAVPVYDATSIAKSIEQIQNQVKQIENLHSQLQAVTGNARLGVLLSDPNVQKALGKYTPQGINLQDLTSGNYDKALQQVAKRIEEDMKRQQGATDPQAQLAQATILNYAQVEQSLSDLEALSTQSQRIASQINLTTDASSKADLANTLSANASQIQIAIAQVNLRIKQMEMLEKQAKQAATQSYGKKMFQR